MEGLGIPVFVNSGQVGRLLELFIQGSFCVGKFVLDVLRLLAGDLQIWITVLGIMVGFDLGGSLRSG